MYRASPDVEDTIVEEANSGAYEILLVGASRGLFSDDELGGVIRNLLNGVKPHLGVLVDRGFTDTGHVFFPILSEHDLELVPLLRRLLQNRTRRVTVLDPNEVWTGDDEPWLERAVRVDPPQLTEAFWTGVDLVVVSPRSWASLKAARSAWLDRLPSVLIFQIGPRGRL